MATLTIKLVSHYAIKLDVKTNRAKLQFSGNGYKLLSSGNVKRFSTIANLNLVTSFSTFFPSDLEKKNHYFLVNFYRAISQSE